MTDKEFEEAEERVHRRLEGYLAGMSDTNRKLIPLVRQLCRDLNEAHNEILRQQDVNEADFNKFDWPEWSNQANSIRWAERETRERLAKTDHWSLYPNRERDTPDRSEKTGNITDKRNHDHDHT